MPRSPARTATDTNANGVRARREALGLSQVALAAAAGTTRQSVGAIEAGRATPAVDLALRIARALDARVEDLFGAADHDAPTVLAEAAPAPAGTRLSLAHIDGRWVAHTLEAQGIRVAADGVARAHSARGLSVEPTRALDDARENLVVMGCAAALGLLADRLNVRLNARLDAHPHGPGGGRVVWLPRSSTAAIEALAARRVHIAGVHLVDDATGEPNVAAVRRIVGRAAVPTNVPFALVTLARWEAGLVARRSPRALVRAASDLAHPGLRLAVRERGAGARELLERALRQAGAPAPAAALELTSHLDVAAAVAMGAADTGVATRDAAIAFGLDFVPLADERYDLVIPRPLLDDARVARLLDALVSAGYRKEIAALGYDVAPTGERIAEVIAA